METNFSYIIALHESPEERVIVRIDGDWQMAWETAMFYTSHFNLVTFYDRNEKEIITMTAEQMKNEQTTVKHEQ